jgi:D-alanyl-D-alanine dipeptidase
MSRLGPALLALLIAGCGADKKSEKSNPAEQAPQAKTENPVATPAIDASATKPLLDSAEQLLVTLSDDWTSTEATVHLFERKAGQPWNRVGSAWPAVLGRGGLGWGIGLHPDDVIGPEEPRKVEGDGKSPAGLFGFGPAYGYDALPSQLSYHKSEADLLCVDDKTSSSYNSIVRKGAVTQDFASAEKMLRKDHLYRHLIVVDHNHIASEQAAVPGQGSCIFLHIWRAEGSPTVGCTAMAEERLKELLNWLDPKRSPRLVTLPRGQYEALRVAWGLPKVTATN